MVAEDRQGRRVFGYPVFHGAEGRKPLNEPVMGVTATSSDRTFWEVASDSGLFAFGGAAFYGSNAGKLRNDPVVGIAVTPTGKGHRPVAAEGGVQLRPRPVRRSLRWHAPERARRRDGGRQ